MCLESLDRATSQSVPQNLEGRVEVPRSVLGLVTRRLLVMNFLEGEQITRLKERVKGLSAHKQAAAKQRILHRVADAYGQMILNRGLFQADPHAGNILVMKGASPFFATPPFHKAAGLEAPLWQVIAADRRCDSRP